MPGTFIYSPAAGTVLPVGTDTLSVTFTPTDTADYATVTATATIVVLPVASATFLTQDTTTQGSWIGTYGTQGYDLCTSSASLPSYATITPAGELNYTWASSTTDLRALQAPGGGSRLAACWHQAPSFSVAVNLNDGQVHDLELYFLDWANRGRIEQVQVTDAASGAVLSTQTVSSFNQGVYLDFAVSGNVVITIAWQAGPNAVLSGLFLDPSVNAITWANPASIVYGTALSSAQLDATANVPGTFIYSPAAGTVLPVGTDTLSVTFTPTDTTDYATVTATATIVVLPVASATFVTQDTTTQGNWIGTYGTQGYDLCTSSASLPSYATITPAGALNFIWASSTTDLRALQATGGGSRLAACWYQCAQLLRRRQPQRRPGPRPRAVFPRLAQPWPDRAGAGDRRGVGRRAVHPDGLVVQPRGVPGFRRERRRGDHDDAAGRAERGAQRAVPGPERRRVGRGGDDDGDVGYREPRHDGCPRRARGPGGHRGQWPCPGRARRHRDAGRHVVLQEGRTDDGKVAAGYRAGARVHRAPGLVQAPMTGANTAVAPALPCPWKASPVVHCRKLEMPFYAYYCRNRRSLD